MAYVDPATIDLSVDKPFTNSKAVAIRDNPTFIAQGGAGAPRIHPSSALDDTITTNGSQSISAGSTWMPSAGVYNMTTPQITAISQLYVSGSWRGYTGTGSVGPLQVMGAIFDGTNMRIRNSDVSVSMTVYWQRFDG